MNGRDVGLMIIGGMIVFMVVVLLVLFVQVAQNSYITKHCRETGTMIVDNAVFECRELVKS
jgi:hypothetical protein